MAFSTLVNAKWHTSLKVLPRISGETVKYFVSQQYVAIQASVRGYKFFLEGYIHDVQGKSLVRYSAVRLSLANYFLFKNRVRNRYRA